MLFIIHTITLATHVENGLSRNMNHALFSQMEEKTHSGYAWPLRSWSALFRHFGEHGKHLKVEFALMRPKILERNKKKIMENKSIQNLFYSSSSIVHEKSPLLSSERHISKRYYNVSTYFMKVKCIHIKYQYQ